MKKELLKYFKITYLLLFLLLSFNAYSVNTINTNLNNTDKPAVNAVMDWKIIPNESSINFQIIQNNSPVTGSFKSFIGIIHASPENLETSHIKIIIDMNSVTTSYSEIADTLKTADWFNVKLFPNAIFTSTKFIKTGDKTYQVQGLLTIKDKTLPLELNFVLKNYSSSHTFIQGSGIIKRTLFGLAKRDWAKTDVLKDDVNISFILSAVR